MCWVLCHNNLLDDYMPFHRFSPYSVTYYKNTQLNNYSKEKNKRFFFTSQLPTKIKM